MEIGEIISNSFKYPLSDANSFLRYAALFLLLVVPSLIMTIGALAKNTAVTGVGFILMLACYVIFVLILEGYLLSVMKEGISQSALIPPYQIGKNIVDTFKTWVLSFVYSIVPVVIITILFFVLFGSLQSATPQNMNAISANMAIIGIVALILYVIFGILLSIGTLRLANTDSLSEGLNFSAVIEDLKGIGIGKFIVTDIVMGIIGGAILGFGALLILIPLVGFIIYVFFLVPFVSLAIAYGLGLLYSEVA